MPRLVKCGLIQASHACSTQETLEIIREANVSRHVDLIDKAGSEGVQMLCMQEIFTGPYFCAEQSTRWYDHTEQIPDGPTTKLMQGLAKKYEMVIVVPLYEEDGAGIYYNTAAVIDADGTYLGKYRKNHIRLLGEVLLQAREPGLSRVPDAIRNCRCLHLLRPPLP
jgi:beta-ureidopropionase